MNNNEYSGYLEPNQDMPYDYSFLESINNNLPTTANNNLIDLSKHASRVYDLTMSEENTQTDSSYNRVIRTKGANKIIIDNKGSSYQSAMSKQPVNYAFETRSDQMPLHDLSAIEVPSGERSNNGEIPNQLATYEDISSVESEHDDDNNTNSDEVNRNYSALDDSTMAKIQKHSEMNKIIINTLIENLPMIMLPPLVGTAPRSTHMSRGRCFFDTKAFQILVHCVMAIVVNSPRISMKKKLCDKGTQTEIVFKEPPVVDTKTTQTDAESVSAPRVKINTRSSKVHQKKESNKEQTARYYQNLHASNQTANVYNNQQDKFYDNQQLFPQLPVEQSYVLQTPELNRNNMQPQMMQYGMPQANAMMQGMESGSNGVQAMQAVNQYGIPHTQTANTMMQRTDCGMSGMQMPQPGIPQHDSSAVPLRADACRNRMQTMMQARSYHHANEPVMAAVNPTYYNHHKSANVLRQEITREIPRSKSVMQTGHRATVPSSGRGRRTHGYYTATNPPYPIYPQWQMPAYQDQFCNNNN